MPDKTLDIQGHRGARGLLPENSIPGFLKAIDLGVNTLEMDLCVTGDQQVLVSHEPYFSPEFCLTPEGRPIADGEMLTYNIYQMTTEEIRAFDCGSTVHHRFPDQEKLKVSKPLLKEVFQQTEQYLMESDKDEVNYNLELKSGPDYDNIFHPEPAAFSQMVYNVVQEAGISWDRVTIQSFDFRILQYFHSTFPGITLAVLIENEIPWDRNIDSLGFTPAIYSCDHDLLTEEIVKAIHDSGMKVIPWTVNSSERMTTLIEWGVDGIITDYPNIAVQLAK